MKESEDFVGVNRGWVREQCAVGQESLKDFRLVCWKLKKRLRVCRRRAQISRSYKCLLVGGGGGSGWS